MSLEQQRGSFGMIWVKIGPAYDEKFLKFLLFSFGIGIL